MCGIAGIVSNRLAPPRLLELAHVMCDQMVHRGPDDEGYAPFENAVIAMRRLSILDIATGHQPFYSSDGRVAVVGNGEIYNYKELAKEITDRGGVLTSGSDMAIVPHLYDQYGVDFVRKLRGMFAIAIWDDRKRQLVLLRDRLGKKPLYYATLSDGLIFSSELRGILHTGLFDPVLRPEVIDRYMLFGRVSEVDSIYQNVAKVPPAHALIFSENTVALKSYWHLSFREKCTQSEEEIIQTTEDLLLESVRLRLQSDVPLGAFLSGGVDSSLVVAMMKRFFDVPVKTFCIGYDDSYYSELKYARMVAHHLGTEHYESVIHPDNPELWGELAQRFSEPFADVSFIPTFHVSKLAKQHVTVVLTGDAGDENFAGYEWYKAMQYIERFERWPQPIQSGLLWLGRHSPDIAGSNSMLQLLRRIRKMSNLLSQNHISKAAQFQALTGSSIREYARVAVSDASILLQSEEEVLKVRQQVLDEYDGADPVERIMYGQLRTLLPETFFVKVDMMSMANSVEARSPFADQHLVEYAAKIPFHFKLRDGESKYVLKKIAERYLPREIIYRQKKGFGIPLKKWIRQGLYKEYVMDTVTSYEFKQRGLLNAAAVERVCLEHIEGKKDHWDIICKVICLEWWMKGQGR